MECDNKEFNIEKYLKNDNYILKEIEKNFRYIDWEILSWEIKLSEKILEKFKDFLDWEIIAGRLVFCDKVKLFEKFLNVIEKKFEFSFHNFRNNTKFYRLYIDKILKNGIDKVEDLDQYSILKEINYKNLDKVVRETIKKGNYDINLVKIFIKDYPEDVVRVIEDTLLDKKEISFLQYYLMSKDIVDRISKIIINDEVEKFILKNIYINFLINNKIKMNFKFKNLRKELSYSELLIYYKNKIFIKNY